MVQARNFSTNSIFWLLSLLSNNDIQANRIAFSLCSFFHQEKNEDIVVDVEEG